MSATDRAPRPEGMTDAQLEKIWERRGESHVLEDFDALFSEIRRLRADGATLRERVKAVCAKAQDEHRQFMGGARWLNTNSETYRTAAARFLVAQDVLNVLDEFLASAPKEPTP